MISRQHLKVKEKFYKSLGYLGSWIIVVAGIGAGIAAILGFQLNRHHTVYDVGSAEVSSNHSEGADIL